MKYDKCKKEEAEKCVACGRADCVTKIGPPHPEQPNPSMECCEKCEWEDSTGISIRGMCRDKQCSCHQPHKELVVIKELPPVARPDGWAFVSAERLSDALGMYASKINELVRYVKELERKINT